MVLGAHGAVAQTGIPMSRVGSRLEVMAGINSAKFNQGDPDARTGLVAGVGLIKPLAPNWAFQPELTYSMKGAKGSEEGVTATIKLSYLELPLLLRFDVPTQAGVHPFFQAGPALALKLSCDFALTDGTNSLSDSCGTVSGDFESDDAKTFDVGAMFGGGFAFKHMDHVVTIGLRYNVGLLDVFSDGGVKNRVLALVGSFEWPWGK